MIVSVIISLLVVLASVAGLLYSGTYQFETENWRRQAQGQDIGNLFAVLLLLGSAYGVGRKSFRSCLIWVGTLFYLLYAYLIYAVALHFGNLFLLYVTILDLVIYSLIFWFLTTAFQKNTTVYPKARVLTFSAYVLITTGVLFALLWLSEIIPSLMSGTVPKSLIEAGLIVNPVHVIDLSTVLPGMIVTGILALKARPTGLYFVVPWLVFTVLMGISVVAAMIIIATAGGVSTAAPMITISSLVLVALGALYYFAKNINSRPSLR